MAEKTPRRMKRFNREKNKKIVEKLKGIPEKKQKDFSKKLKIQKETPDSIAETIFEQLKQKEERQKLIEKENKKSKSKNAESIIQKSSFDKRQSFGKKQANETREEEIPLWKKKRMERLGQTKEKKNIEKPVQEKEEKTELKRKHGKKGKKEIEPEEKEIELDEIKGTKINGLFGDLKKTKSGLAKKELDELNLDLELDELDEEETPELDDSDETEKKGVCVNCKQEFNELIFCSKCGNAFCDKCAKIKHKEGTKTKYVCPHCGNVTKK
ncbi:MAG: hypothetical protein COT90_01550 [Candidatus Diapherotrites archaeon CG10_big_fil_rev_8_21_14_0_10_31_34]|nr:MAG: hypothetical protein COT90_01550 [Candidatus Diapherotrites archaeon CG10_big_fil_rev_8_21_14_0_10_31_34]